MMDVVQAPSSLNLFKPSNWLIKIDFIEQLLLNNTLVAVLTDERGGKTCFSHILGSELDEDFNYIALIASTELKISDIHSKIISQFHPEKTFPTFTALISEINAQKKHFLLLIDDAHLLHVSVIEELLSTLCHYDQSNFFHICLVGNLSLNNELYQLALHSFKNKIHAITLGNLSERETRTYLLKQLHAQNPESRISDEELKKFYELTKGNISQINNQFPVYFKKKLQARRPITRFLKSFAIFCGCLVLILSGKYLWQHRPAFPEVRIVHRQGFAYPSFFSKIPEKELISHICPFDQGAKRLAIQPPPFNKIVEIEEDLEESLEKLVIVDRVLTIPKNMHRYIGMPATQPNSSVEEPFLESSVASIGALEPKEEKASTNSSQYTIQILASLKESDIDFYLRKYPSLPHIKKQIAQRDGRNWFVLTLGDYPAFTEAMKALQQLPLGLRKEGAWVRSANELKRVA